MSHRDCDNDRENLRLHSCIAQRKHLYRMGFISYFSCVIYDNTKLEKEVCDFNTEFKKRSVGDRTQCRLGITTG